MLHRLLTRRLRGAGIFMLALLLIEFVDEFAYGLRETAWPFIRTDLDLTYAQIGLLIGLPVIVGSLTDIIAGLLADRPGWRSRLIFFGGIGFALDAAFIGLATSFEMMLIASLVLSPMNGAFVNLAQATLMDVEPTRHEQNMARWTFFGVIGVLLAPGLLLLVTGLGGTWRTAFAVIVIVTLAAWLLLWWQRRQFPATVTPITETDEDDDASAPASIGGLWPQFVAALRLLRGDVLRWFVLLEFSDLLLDVLLSFLALYFVDVVGVDAAGAALAVTIWVGIGMIGDFLLIPLLERVNGLAYLRVSVTAELFLYPLFLLVEPLPVKLVLLAIIGFFNAGWYSVLQAQIYSALPGKSGTVTTLGAVFGPLTGALPVIVGAVANAAGLPAAMWLLWLGPLALFIGLPRRVAVWRTRE